MKSNQPETNRSAEASRSDDDSATIQLPRERLGRLGSRVLHFAAIGSTNDVAAALAAADDSEGAIVVADQQTAGRGRRGRQWFSPPGSGLYVSVVLAPSRARVDPLRATTLLTIAAGVAVAEGIARATGVAVELKWPNDIYIGRRKLAGILAEGVAAGASVDRVVLGYGVNIATTVFPPEIAGRAIALEAASPRPVDRRAVLVETLAALAQRYDDLLDARFDAILDAWRACAPSATGAPIAWTTAVGLQRGITAGIADDGVLLVDVDGRPERIVAGEIDWTDAFRERTM